MTKPADLEVGGLFRFRIDLAYDGTEFWGWAMQPGIPSVQGELVTALTTVFGESKDAFGMRVAGRTDAGVHATAQVAHIDLTAAQLKRLGRSVGMVGKLNDLLPPSIRIHSVTEAPFGFDARFSASYRRYRYRIADGLAPKNPLKARYTLWLNHELDLLAMKAASLELLGMHDFASFCRRKPNATTIREVREIQIKRNPVEENIIEVELLADAFCHNMVRSIVGALIAVGEGRASVEDIDTRLKAADRTSSYKVVAAKGLTLMEIGYPPAHQMAAQVARTKDTRTLDETD